MVPACTTITVFEGADYRLERSALKSSAFNNENFNTLSEYYK